jgi:methyl-galactoside transport system substrate-binding protein
MKRHYFALAAVVLGACLSTGLAGCDQAGGKPRIGVALFNVDDGFVSAARRALEAEASGKARISILNGQNQQTIQNAQIDAMIVDKAKAIIVNPVDSSVLVPLVFRVKAGNVPTVFFSRDASGVAVNSWDKAYFVGVKTEEADALQVEILAEYWKSHDNADKNGDGSIQYIILRGTANRVAAEDSDANRQKAFDAVGIPSIKFTEMVANWSRVDAQKAVTAILEKFDASRIEAVICANDEMALGAIEALKVAGFFKNERTFMPVVGVDGTRFALDAIQDGSLLGTVRGDAESQGKAAFDLAFALAKGEDPANAGWALTDGKSVLVHYQKVTQENYRGFMQ